MTFSLFNHITAPLNSDQLAASQDENGFVTVTVTADFGALVSNDYETNLDWFSELVTGTVSMSDISFELTGVNDAGEAFIKITGDVTMITEED